MALALAYLRRTGQNAPAIETRAKDYLARGHDRLLGFEVREEPGGFSLWGHAPASVFLTSYALMELQDLASVHPVDPQLLARVRRHLRAKCNTDGSWSQDRQETFALTAYAAWALALAGEDTGESLGWLDGHVDAVDDPYRLALAALAHLAADPASAEGAALAARARTARRAVSCTLVGAHGHASEAETTALQVQALLGARASAGRVGEHLDRLVGFRGASGSFGTTQATVQALRALLGADTRADRPAARVDVRAGETVLASHALDANAIEPVALDLGERTETELRIALEGDRRLRGTLSRTTWEPWTGGARVPGRVALDVRYPDGPLPVGRTARAEVVLSNPSDARAVTVTAEIGLPPGCDAEPSAVEGDGAMGIERGETTMVLYLDDLEPGARRVFTIAFVPRYRLDVHTAPSRAYEYYTPEEAAVLPPARVVAR